MTTDTAVRILITGATGFIGRALAPALVRAGWQVSILVREAYAQAGLHSLPPELTAVRDQIQVLYADLRNFQLTVRALRQAQPERVVHLAAAGVTDPFLAEETAVRHNVSGTINLARACFEKTGATQQLVVARTPGEQVGLNVYAASKAAAWAFCQMYGRTQQWPIQGAMIFQAYGPGQSAGNFIPAAVAAALAGQDFPMTAGTQQRDWIHVSDVVAGLLAVLQAPLLPGQTVDLGSGQTNSVAEVADLVYRLAGKGGRPLIGALPARPGEEAVQRADAAGTGALLGWQTAVTLEGGLQELITKPGFYQKPGF